MPWFWVVGSSPLARPGEATPLSPNLGVRMQRVCNERIITMSDTLSGKGHRTYLERERLGARARDGTDNGMVGGLICFLYGQYRRLTANVAFNRLSPNRSSTAR